MIRIECDACEQAFEVGDDRAGTKVPCPECGDVNRVPGGEAAPAPKARTPADTGGAEEIIKTIRPAMFRAHPFRFVLIALLLIGGATLAIAAPRSESVWDWLTWPGVLAAAGAVIWWLVWWLAAFLWVRVEITNKRTIRHEGIVRRHSTEVLHDHVRSVDINQNFLQRMFGVGYIGIDSAGQDGIEIEVRDLPRPYEIKSLIDRYRKM